MAKECLASSFCFLVLLSAIYEPITINTTLTRLFQDATMFEFKRVPLLLNSTFKFLMSEQNLILLGFGIWLGAISVVLFLFLSFFRRLTKGIRDADLVKVLERILKEQGQGSEAIKELNRQVALIKEEGTKHVQKVGLVRFNPFKEIGGDHSFSLAVLDGNDTGVIITGLHTRERTRVYMKAIKNGKSEFELSEDEKKALTKAQKD